MELGYTFSGLSVSCKEGHNQNKDKKVQYNFGRSVFPGILAPHYRGIRVNGDALSDTLSCKVDAYLSLRGKWKKYDPPPQRDTGKGSRSLDGIQGRHSEEDLLGARKKRPVQCRRAQCTYYDLRADCW